MTLSSRTEKIRIENGKIAEEWQLDDMLTFMMQLGIELRPKEGEK